MTQLKRGDKVWAWDNSTSRGHEAIYVTTIEGARWPFCVVAPEDEVNFMTGGDFGVAQYRNAEPLRPDPAKLKPGQRILVKAHWMSEFVDALFVRHDKNGKPLAVRMDGCHVTRWLDGEWKLPDD